MQLRITQKLGKKIKRLPKAAPDDRIHPALDWVARLFTIERVQYIMITNRLSLLSTVIDGRGVNTEKNLIKAAAEAIRETLNHYGFPRVWDRIIEPSLKSSSTCKIGDRRINGCMNDLEFQADIHVQYGGSPESLEIGHSLNKVVQCTLDFKYPRKEFAAICQFRDPADPRFFDFLAFAEAQAGPVQNSLNEEAVKRLFHEHEIDAKKIQSVKGSFNKDVFFINDSFVLRPSVNSMMLERHRFIRIQSLDHVPRIKFEGIFKVGVFQPLHYLVLSQLPGTDLIQAAAALSDAQLREFGRSTATFLDSLHKFRVKHYDIGHYLPIIPHFEGSWQEGHILYWEYLQEKVEQLELHESSQSIIRASFEYLQEWSDYLGFSKGSRLLHNDFHFKNILAHEGRFSGVIDWECSQYGEPDFDLCHLIHWTLYPPVAGLNFKPFLSALLEAAPLSAQIPGLAKRLTIYQIEHEIFQIVLSQGNAEQDRIPRLAGWLKDKVDGLLTCL